MTRASFISMMPTILRSTCTTATWSILRTCCRTARSFRVRSLRSRIRSRRRANIATQIIAQVASNQYGGQSISLTHLAPFVDVSRQKIRADVADELRELGITDEEKIAKIAEKRLKAEIAKGIQDHSVSGGHASDDERAGAFRDGVHVSGRGAQRAGARGSCAHHRGDAQSADPRGQERVGCLGDACLPKAHLCSGRGQHPRREQILVSDAACGEMHGKAHGAPITSPRR